MAKTLEKFNAMYPDMPRYTDGNHWFSLQNVDPLYYLSLYTQEKNAAPLTPCPSTIQITGGVGNSINGNIIQILPATVTKVSTPNVIDYDCFILTDNAFVYGVSQSQVTSLGRPAANTGDTTARIQIGYNGLLVYSSALGNYIFTLPLSDGTVSQSTTWTARTPGDYYGLTIVSIEPFLNYIALSSKASSSAVSQSQVNLYSYATTLGTSANYKMDLGNGWNIVRMQNWINRYLVIGATYSANIVAPSVTLDSTSNMAYLFFWNGTGTRYQYSVRVPGGIVDMIVSNDTVYVVVLEKFSQYALYQVVGQEMKKVCNLNYDVPVTTPGQTLFRYPEGVGVVHGNKGAFVVTQHYGEDYRFFLAGTAGSMQVFNVGSSGYIYSAYASAVYTQTTPQINGVPQSLSQINAVSQWVPVGSKLISVDVWYDSAPVNVGEYIRITLETWGEDQNDGVTTYPLADITSTTKDTRIHTTLDAKGVTPTMARVTVQTLSNPNSTWRPIIRKIQINESAQ